MCKTYEHPSSYSEKKESVFAPVNERMLISPEDRPTDELEEMEMNLQITLGRKTIKRCPLCPRFFESEHAYQLHLRKHSPRCPHCSIKLKSWKQMEKHEQSCPRKNGLVLMQRLKRPEKKKRPFKCQLCKRRYETEQHLRNHQINRCQKRYVSPAWIVKI